MTWSARLSAEFFQASNGLRLVPGGYPHPDDQPLVMGDETGRLLVEAPRRLSETEAALYLGVAKRTLQDWRCRKIGPAYSKLGAGMRARIVYDVADLDAFLAAGRVEPKAA